FRFKIIVVTSSTTPSTVENSSSAPSICTDVTAAPGSEDNRMRRKELPSVVPYPLSSGSTTNLPNVAASLLSGVSLFGFSISIIPLSPPLQLTSLPTICYTNSHYHYLLIK